MGVSALDRIIPNVNLEKWKKSRLHSVALLITSALFSVSLIALIYSASFRHRRVTHSSTIGQWGDYVVQGGAGLLAVCSLLLVRFAQSSLLQATVVASLCFIILGCTLLAFDRDQKYTSVYRHDIGPPGGYACLVSTLAAVLLVSLMDAKTI